MTATNNASRGTRTRIFSSLHELPTAYQALMTAAGRDNFFHGYAWFCNLVQTTLEDGANLRIYAVEATDESNGTSRPLASLVCRTPAAKNGSILHSRPVGQRTLSAMTNFQTCSYSPALDSGGDISQATSTLVDAIFEDNSRWDVIDLNCMDRKAPYFSELQAALRRTGMVVRAYPHFGSWYDRFDDGYDNYLKGRSASDRKELQNYARKARKLARNNEMTLRVFSTPDELGQALQAYDAITAASWKPPEFYPRFTRGLFEAAAATGVLRLGVLYVDGEPAATEVGLVTDGRATMIKTAYNQRFRKQSVGAIVMQQVIKHLVDEEKVKEVDFGRDDQSYKSLWLTQRRERWGLLAVSPRTFAGNVHLLWQAASEVQNHAREIIVPRARPVITALKNKPIVKTLRNHYAVESLTKLLKRDT